MDTYCLGSAWILHLWRTESNPRPKERTTTSTDHVCGLGFTGKTGLSVERARLGVAVYCARTGWTRARITGARVHYNERGLTTGTRLWWWRQWAGTAAAALAVGCCGGDGTTGLGHGTRRGQVAKLGCG